MFQFHFLLNCSQALWEKGYCYYSHIIKHLGSNHDARDEQAVHVQRNDKRVGMPVDEPVNVYVANHKACRAAARVLVDPLQVLWYADPRGPDPVEFLQALPGLEPPARE